MGADCGNLADGSGRSRIRRRFAPPGRRLMPRHSSVVEAKRFELLSSRLMTRWEALPLSYAPEINICIFIRFGNEGQEKKFAIPHFNFLKRARIKCEQPVVFAGYRQSLGNSAVG